MNISTPMRTPKVKTGLFRTHRPANLGVPGRLIFLDSLALVIGDRKGWSITR